MDLALLRHFERCPCYNLNSLATRIIKGPLVTLVIALKLDFSFDMFDVSKARSELYGPRHLASVSNVIVILYDDRVTKIIIVKNVPLI